MAGNLMTTSWLFDLSLANAVTTVLFLFVFYLVYKSRQPPCKYFPPGAEGWPLLGCVPYVGPRTHLERVLLKWGKENYGPIFYVKLGSTRMVILNTFEAAKEGFLRNGKSLAGRYQPEVLGNFHSFRDGLVFIDYSEKWIVQRKFGLNTLREFGMGKKSVEGKMVEESDILCETVASASRSPNSFNFARVLITPTFNVMNSLVYGKRLELENDPLAKDLLERSTDPKSREIMETIFSMLIVFPYLKHLPFLKFYAGQQKIFSETRIKVVQKHIEEHKETYDSKNIRDFIDRFLYYQKHFAQDQQEKATDYVNDDIKCNGDSHVKKEKPTAGNRAEDCEAKDGMYFTDSQLLNYLIDLFAAGTDTTATTIYWALVLLSSSPEDQDRIQSEIDAVIGPEGRPSFDCKQAMPFTQAVMQEVFRMRPVFPLLVTHKALEDVNIMGYHIPKGTVVTANVWGIQNDPDVWSNPEQFQPSRHLDDQGRFVKSDRVMPFSLGPRQCLGKLLAEKHFFVFLVRLLQRFRFCFPEDQPSPDIRGTSLFVLSPQKIRIMAKER